jgi:spermidine/putrescine transport system permease protein
MSKPTEGGFNWRHAPEFGFFTTLMVLFLYAPLAVLVVYSFNANRLVTIWGGFSLRWFAKVVQNGDIQAAAVTSLIVAAAATLCSVTIAVAAALALARGRLFVGRGAATGLIMMPLVVPEIVVATTTLIFFSTLGMTIGLLNLIIAHTVFCIPFAMLPIQARLQAMGATNEDAARDLYGSEWRIFRRITLPLLMPGIVAGGILAFVSSLDDFLISFMVSGAGNTTLPVYVYGMMRMGVTPEVNAISTILLVISTLLAFCVFIFSRPTAVSGAPAAKRPSLSLSTQEIT